MRQFNRIEDVDSLTDEEALDIVQKAREALVEISGHNFVGLDDHGDYLAAAIDNYHDLFHFYWDNDGQNPAFVEAVKQWLKQSPIEWGGSDGEIRFDLFSSDYEEANN